MVDKSQRPQSRSTAQTATRGMAPAKGGMAPAKSSRPMGRPDNLMENANLARAMGGAAGRERQDAMAGRAAKGMKYKKGGMVKGECKGTGGMVSGKKFSGTY